MKFEFPHAFDQKEAMVRVQALTSYWSQKHGIQCEWKEHTAAIKGKSSFISFEGTFTVEDRRLKADMKVSFGGELVGKPYIERKLSEYLDPKVSLESLQAR